MSSNPIIEVFMSITLDDNNVLNENHFKLANEKLKTIESKISKVQATTLKVESNPPSHTSYTKIVGTVINDNNKITGIRSNDIFFSSLEPYISWNNYFPESIEKLFNIIQLLEINQVTSVFLQYKNLIKIPRQDGLYIEDYFKFYPVTDSIEDSMFTESDAKVKLYNKDLKIHSEITQIFKQDDPNDFSFYIDINNGTPLNETDTAINHSEIEISYKKLHDYANYLFKAIITDKTRNNYLLNYGSDSN